MNCAASHATSEEKPVGFVQRLKLMNGKNVQRTERDCAMHMNENLICASMRCSDLLVQQNARSKEHNRVQVSPPEIREPESESYVTPRHQNEPLARDLQQETH